MSYTVLWPKKEKGQKALGTKHWAKWNDAEKRRRGELIGKQWTIKERSELFTAHRLLITYSILDTLGIPATQ